MSAWTRYPAPLGIFDPNNFKAATAMQTWRVPAANTIIQFVGHYLLRPLPMRAPPPDRSGSCLTHSSLFGANWLRRTYVFLTIDFCVLATCGRS